MQETNTKEKGRSIMAGSKEQRAGGIMNLRISPPLPAPSICCHLRQAFGGQESYGLQSLST